MLGKLPGAHGANDASTTVLGTFNPASTGQAGNHPKLRRARGRPRLDRQSVDEQRLHPAIVVRRNPDVVESGLGTAKSPELILTYTLPPIYVNAGPTEQ